MEEVRKAIGIKTIEIDGEVYKIKPKTGQIVEYLTKLREIKEGKRGNEIKEQVDFVVSLLLNAGNGLTDDETRLLVETNFKESIINTHVALGLMSKEDLEKEELKKKTN